MKNQICFLFFIFLFETALGQIPSNLKKLKADKDYENLHSVILGSDSLQTAFLIWIRKEVKQHKHEWHSENVLIIQGKGEFKIGDKIYRVSKGDYFNIPVGLPHSVKVTSTRPMKVLSVQSPQFSGDDRIFLE